MLILMLMLTLAAVLGVVYLAGIVWSALFVSAIPVFVSGIVGGLAALPVWEGLKQLKSGQPEKSEK